MPDVIQQIFKRLAVPLPDAPEVVAGAAATDACLPQLPTDLLHHLLRLGLFTARDLSALACACRRLASVAAARPVLLPKLYEHHGGGGCARARARGRRGRAAARRRARRRAGPRQDGDGALARAEDGGRAARPAARGRRRRRRRQVGELRRRRPRAVGARRAEPRVAPAAARVGADRAVGPHVPHPRCLRGRVPRRRRRGDSSPAKPGPRDGPRRRAAENAKRRAAGARAAPSSSPRARSSTTAAQIALTSTAAAAPAAPRRSGASPSRVEACTPTPAAARRMRRRFAVRLSAVDGASVARVAAAQEGSALQVRWLRLVIDEGHRQRRLSTDDDDARSVPSAAG